MIVLLEILMFILFVIAIFSGSIYFILDMNFRNKHLVEKALVVEERGNNGLHKIQLYNGDIVNYDYPGYMYKGDNVEAYFDGVRNSQSQENGELPIVYKAPTTRLMKVMRNICYAMFIAVFIVGLILCFFKFLENPVEFTRSVQIVPPKSYINLE